MPSTHTTGSKSGNNNQSGKSNRGFASMDQEKQREIASKGGQAAHEKGTAHEFTSEEARQAGSKGGARSHGGQGSRSATASREDNSDDSRTGTARGSKEQQGESSRQSNKNS